MENALPQRVLDFQLDTLYIHHMTNLMKAVQKRLNGLIFGKNRRSNWYENILGIFILLTSTEQVYMAQIRYLRRFG